MTNGCFLQCWEESQELFSVECHPGIPRDQSKAAYTAWCSPCSSCCYHVTSLSVPSQSHPDWPLSFSFFFFLIIQVIAILSLMFFHTSSSRLAWPTFYALTSSSQLCSLLSLSPFMSASGIHPAKTPTTWSGQRDIKHCLYSRD